MEKRLKEHRLSVLFIGTLVAYAVSTFVLCGALLMALLAIANTGVLLPANVQELALSAHIEDIRKAAPDAVGAMIPEGATYGIYDQNGKWQLGTLAEDRRADAWARYEMRTTTPDDEAFYKFIPMNDGNVCIARYYLGMRYASAALNDTLPPPERLLAGAMVLAAVGNLLYCARRFARAINRRLETVQAVTSKIAARDLDFEVEANTGIREMNDVMGSLDTLKNALRASLAAQWQQEQAKQTQLSALAHDIKTPLTVIRGNAELLEETAEDAVSRGCATYIVDSARDIDCYLERMREVLANQSAAPCDEVQTASHLVTVLQQTAQKLTAAAQCPLAEEIDALDGRICCQTENVIRAWQNILANALTYTDATAGVQCRFAIDTIATQPHLVCTVRDYGTGFTAKDLQYATQAFYIGDESRHTRNHQGLGLAIANDIAKAQGGTLTLANAQQGTGAEVSLWLKMEE